MEEEYSQAAKALLTALAKPDSAERLRVLDANGDLLLALPELAAAKGVKQPKEHYWDVFVHSIEAVAAVEKVVTLRLVDPSVLNPLTYFDQPFADGYQRLTLLKLAALLHDVAKPATKSFDAKGRMRFIGHQKEGAPMAALAAVRLGLPVEAERYLYVLVEQHLRPGHLGRDGDPTERALLHFYRDTAGVTIDVLYLNLADHLAMRGPQLGQAEWEEHLQLSAAVLRHYFDRLSAKPAERLVTGHDLMKELGLPPGPRVGRLLELVEDARRRGEIASRAEAVALARRAK